MKAVPVALVVVLLAWVMFVCAATTTIGEITGRKSPPPPPPPPRPQPIELNLTVTRAKASVAVAKTRYYAFLATLRRQLEDSSKSLFGIPMLRKLSQAEYMYVKLISAAGNSIVVAINKKDIYVQGYTYKDGTQARCFKDVFTSGQCNVIFPNAQKPEQERNIGIIGSYPALEGRAGDRSQVELGMRALGSFIDKISVTQPSTIPKDEAKLLLIVIQMVCEAVRFKYIEKQVKDSIPMDVYPNAKVISLEENWGKLSKAIASVKTQTENFKNPVQLKTAEGNGWVVTKVRQIKPDMGLLNAVGASELLKWLLDHDVLGSINYITA